MWWVHEDRVKDRVNSLAQMLFSFCPVRRQVGLVDSGVPHSLASNFTVPSGALWQR